LYPQIDALVEAWLLLFSLVLHLTRIIALLINSGGPGCSGLLGWGTEHGPFFISKNGSLHKNPYSWNKLANMLYIEQPAGVGLGYCDRAEDYKTDDAQAAADNYRLILDFLKKFPERQSNPFYIASESYGGHYMPQLALEILDNDPHGEKINFQGLLVGNPYVDPYSNAVTQFESYYSHGLLSKPLFDEWSVACRDPNLYESDKCEEITDDFFRQFGPGINPYALDYPVCTQQIKEGEEGEEELYDEADYLEEYMETHQAEQQQTSQTNIQGEDSVIHKLLQLRLASVGRPLLSKRHAYGGYNTEEAADYTTGSTGEMVDPEDDAPKLAASAQLKTFLNTTKTSPPFLPEHDKYKPCAQEYLEKYLNRHDVRKALHVNPKRITAAWLACGGVEYSTADVDTPTTHLYRELVRRAKAGEHTLQMLIFSGDDDSICSTAGTQAWIWNQIGSDPVNDRKIWKAWKVRGQTAGYVTHFNVTSDVPKENIRADHVRRLLKDAPKEASFIFATVHGAGHEVPAYRPLEALALFDRFMNRDW